VDAFAGLPMIPALAVSVFARRHIAVGLPA
jgi:hypothetical protein